MTLATGTKLGPYEILSPIGAGGMGEVYRAKDSRLDREVAIKVLPEAMTRDPERVARFQREAKVLASLNHPNIAAIYGFDDHRLETGATHFLVMELVEGETLSKRLKQSGSAGLAIEDALDVAKQMAEALEAAHDKGVIHRDLKPANVMITPEGKVKVLDFGLAKAMGTADDRSQTEIANSPTITANYTRPGVVLGTAAYMSPEQARGKPLDKRTDIWSFGVVFLECLTGQTTFGGETISDSIGAILHKEPDWTSLPGDTPPTVHLLLRRCLSKDASKRLRDIGDARIEIENAIVDPTSSSLGLAAAAIDTKGVKSKSWVWPALAVLLAIALCISLWRSRNVVHDTGATSNSALVVTEISQLTDMPGMQIKPSLSPNGKSLLFVAREGNDFDIFLQRVGGENPINLTADCASDDYDPAFSPDGERIAFRSQREGGGLFVMGATGESPRRVSKDGFDPAWSPDGTKLAFTTEDAIGPYSRATVAQLWEIELQSLEKTRLITKHDAVAPCYAPSGKLIAFWAAIAGVRDIFTIPADGGEPQAVTNDVHTDWNPFFSPDGRTLYFISDRSGTPDLWRVPIDPKTGRPQGSLRPVTAGVTTIDQASIAADGKHIMFAAPMMMNEIIRYEFDSKSGKIVGEGKTMYATTSGLQQFDVTSDGRRLTYRTAAPREDIIVMNIDGTGRRRLMDDTHKDRGPRWSPDEAWILFYSNRGGHYDIWRIRPDGTGLHRLTNTQRNDLTQPVLSEDGRLLATPISLETGQGLVLLSLEKAIADITEPLAIPIPQRSDFAAWDFSPDARHLAGNGVFGELQLYDVESQEITRVAAPDGGDMLVSQVAGMDWIDNNRLIVWDEKRDAAFIFDRTTDTSHVVSGIKGPCQICVVEGGKALVVNRLRAESDIWMLRLETINEPSSDGNSVVAP